MSEIAAGAGFRHVQIMLLDTAGLLAPPAVAGATPESGYQLSGAKALTLNIPEPEKIIHYGDDRVFAVDVLPPKDAVSGELRTGKTNLTVDAVLSNVNVVTLGDIRMLGRGSNQQGTEPQVCILAYRQALDADEDEDTFGIRRWLFVLMPAARVIAKGGTMEESGADENGYMVYPTMVKQYPWAHDFSVADEGFTESPIIWGITIGRPMLCTWKADGVEDEFTLPATARGITNVHVYDLATGAAPAGITISTTKVTFAVAPTDGNTYACIYEQAA